MKSGTQRPTEESTCLEPHELLDLIEETQGNVSPARKGHITSCAICEENFASMLEMWHLARQVPLGVTTTKGSPVAAEAVPSSLLSSRKRGMPRASSPAVIVCLLLIGAGVSLIGIYSRQARQTQTLALLRNELQDVHKQASTQISRSADLQASLMETQTKLKQSQEREHAGERAIAHQKQEETRRLAQVQQEYQLKLHTATAPFRLPPQTMQGEAGQGTAQLLAKITASLHTTTLGAGDNNDGSLALYAPVRVVVPENTVAFTWQAMADAQYTVEVHRPDGSLVVKSPLLKEAQWKTDLPDNTLAVPYYTWFVKTSTNATYHGARFSVLTKTSVNSEHAPSDRGSP